MKNRLGPGNRCIFLAGLLLAVLAPLPSPAQSSVPCTFTVKVDGINQEVMPQSPPAGCKRTWPVLHPGDQVVVKVVRAHLLHYGYEIKLTKEENLSSFNGVVGVGELSDSATESFSGAVPNSGEPGKKLAAPTRDDIEKLLVDTRRAASAAEAAATKLIDDFENTERKVTEPWESNPPLVKNSNPPKLDENSWPSTYKTAVDSFFSSTGYDAIRKDLNQAWGDAQAGKDATFVLQVPGADEEIDRLGNQFQTLIAELKAARGALDKTAIRVRRWQGILGRPPVLEQTFLVDRRSKRYTVAVFREPLSEAAKAIEIGSNSIAAIDAVAEEDDDETAAAEKNVFASFSYEGHALYRFNVSLGAAALYRPDMKTFSIGSQIRDGAVSHVVRESGSSEYGVEPIAMIGTYLRPVDNYDPDRPAAWMVTVGTEISSSPSTYMLGLACDFNPGFGIAFGVTRYEKTVLADGWEPGQLVPTDDEGAPVIDAVPTRKDDGIGFYTALVFRPSIFGAFWRARTQS